MHGELQRQPSVENFCTFISFLLDQLHQEREGGRAGFDDKAGEEDLGGEGEGEGEEPSAARENLDKSVKVIYKYIYCYCIF